MNVLESVFGWNLKLFGLISPPLVRLEASGPSGGLPASSPGLAVGVLLLFPHETSLLHDVDQAGGEGLRPLLGVHVQAVYKEISIKICLLECTCEGLIGRHSQHNIFIYEGIIKRC